MTPPVPTLSTFAIAIVIGGLCAVAAMCAHLFDRDAGGYHDGFLTKATFPDKLVHAVCGALVTFALAELMPVTWAVGGLAAIGAAYELGQGFFSVYDWIADVAGALSVAIYLSLLA